MSHSDARCHYSNIRETVSAARFDRIKEEIGWLKVVFSILVAVDASLVAWLAQNYARTEGILLIPGPTATISITFAIVWVNRQAHKRLEELEEL